MDKEYFHVDAGEYVPGKSFAVVRPASLEHPKSNAVMFITTGNMDKADAFSKAENCLIFWPTDISVPTKIRDRHAVYPCDNPHLQFCRFFRDHAITYLPQEEPVDLINGAYISPKAKIGTGVTIMPGAYISGECEIGDGTYIGCGAKLTGEISIGKNVVIRENAVIGADGLSTDRDEDGTPVTMPQFGRVVLEDEVQIGANTVVQRGAIDETRICRRAKIDNCAFVSHNCFVGENTFMVTESVMLGSSTVGKNSMVSSNATIRNGVHIGDNVLVGMGSVVVKDVPNEAVVKGNPAR